MRPPFPLKEIALQSGLSLATVDRALHGRSHVAKATGLRIEAAIAELERQYAQARIAGRRLVIDIVMETPQRFSNAVRAAFEAELPALRPASLSARFHVADTFAERDLLAILARIRRRGSHGVVLKVPSTPAIADMAGGLMQSGIPVVTLVTDLPAPVRLGYVGMDNRVAGATVAYLLARMAGPAGGKVLLTLSSARFAGEEERERGFCDALQRDAPHLGAVTVSEGFGVDRTTEQQVKAALAAEPEIRAVYSIGGGNRAILRAFAQENRKIDVFAAHDLDAENRTLLAGGQLTFVIHHDLRQDARSACQMVMAHHRMLPKDFRTAPSRVAIATPHEVM
ncbi:MAG: LacI family DNA-binding transcriptional regulator [Alphaproteobacteria bacterium]|nr:LacI family DNA-binding transcriptional regulator [Alphaproteobacteria bacterium]